MFVYLSCGVLLEMYAKKLGLSLNEPILLRFPVSMSFFDLVPQFAKFPRLIRSLEQDSAPLIFEDIPVTVFEQTESLCHLISGVPRQIQARQGQANHFTSARTAE